MITVNETDLSTLGFTARSRAGFSLAGRRHTVLAIPGAYPVRAGALVQPGRLSVSGTLRGGTHANVLSNLDSLALLLQGECVVRFDDVPDREWVGHLDDSSRLALHDPQWIQRTGALTLDWTLPDPRARERAETTRTGSGALVLGSAPSPIRVEVTTATATIRVRAGGSSGAILTELVWTGTSGALIVDGETQTVTRAGANAISGITPASVFPLADPAAGADYVQVPAGAIVTYRRRWW